MFLLTKYFLFNTMIKNVIIKYLESQRIFECRILRFYTKESDWRSWIVSYLVSYVLSTFLCLKVKLVLKFYWRRAFKTIKTFIQHIFLLSYTLILTIPPIILFPNHSKGCFLSVINVEIKGLFIHPLFFSIRRITRSLVL